MVIPIIMTRAYRRMDLQRNALRFRIKSCNNAPARKRKHSQKPYPPSEQMKICHRLVNLDIRYGKRKALGKAIDA